MARSSTPSSASFDRTSSQAACQLARGTARKIYRGQGHSIAWFTDLVGNVLSVIQEA